MPFIRYGQYKDSEGFFQIIPLGASASNVVFTNGKNLEQDFLTKLSIYSSIDELKEDLQISLNSYVLVLNADDIDTNLIKIYFISAIKKDNQNFILLNNGYYAIESNIFLNEKDIKSLIEDHNISAQAHTDLRKKISELEKEIAKLSLILTEITDNNFVIGFQDINDIILTKGIWNKEGEQVIF